MLWPLPFRQMTFLATLLLATVALIFSHTIYQTAWSTLFADVDHDPDLPITEVRFVKTLPAEPVLNRVLAGATDLPTAIVPLGNYWKGDSRQFSAGLIKTLGADYPKGDLHTTFAVYYDLDLARLKGIDRPVLTFFGASNDWDLYADRVLVASGSYHDHYISIPIPRASAKTVRLTWVMKNHWANRLYGIDITNGVPFDRLWMRPEPEDCCRSRHNSHALFPARYFVALRLSR